MSWLPEERWGDEFRRLGAEFAALRLRAQKGYFDYASNSFNANEWKDWLRMEADSPDGFDFSMVSPALDREARAVAEEMGANRMYAVSLMMFVTSVLAGRYTGVRVKRMNKFLRLMLYVMNIAPPGSAKTGIKDLFMQKLFDLHEKYQDEFKELRMRWDDAKKNKDSPYERQTRESYGDIYRDALALRLQLQGALAPDLRANMEVELSRLDAQLANSTFEVVERRDKSVVWMSNVTMPRILSAAAASNAIGLIYDDVNVFISNFGIGSKQKGEDDSSHLTSMHSGEAVNMERQGEDNSYYCADPCVSLFINAQARMLKFLLEKSFIDSGLTYRFIPVIESDAAPEAPEDFDENFDYFSAKADDFEALVREEEGVDIVPYKFYAMCDRMILHLYKNPAYSSANRNVYTFSHEANAVRALVRDILKTITAAFKANRWEKHTSMVSKMHEMTDKFALIFQIMHDFSQPAPAGTSPGDLLFDGAKPDPHANRTVSAWAVHAGFQFSRLVFDSWMQLPKRANVEDDEMSTLMKDEGKTRGGAPSKDYTLLWCYLAKHLSKGGEPGDPTFSEEDKVPEFPRAMLEGIIRQSNGFDPKAPARLLKDGNKSMDDNGGDGGPAAATKFRLLMPAFGGTPVDMRHVDEFIAERVAVYQKRQAAKNERTKKCEA